MKNETKNYKFPKPGEDDFYDINEYNGTLDSIDEELMNQEQKKLDKTGDSSQTVTTFEEEVLRENLESGESLSLTHGKIKKWFSEMKNIAFSGRASDIETDGANRFVSDGEKKDWNSKVSADGDISDTKIQSLDSVSAEFPVPEEGETSRQFLGKVRKFIQDFNNFKTGIITVGKLVNNGSTTAGGYALDARYGKTLFDLYNNLNSDLMFKGNTTDFDVQINDTSYTDKIIFNTFHYNIAGNPAGGSAGIVITHYISDIYVTQRVFSRSGTDYSRTRSGALITDWVNPIEQLSNDLNDQFNTFSVAGSILDYALTVSKHQIVFTGTETTDLPSEKCRYTLATINKRVTKIFITIHGTDNRIYRNFYSGSQWLGWSVDALDSDLEKMNRVTEVTLTAAGWSSSAPYTQAVNISGMVESDRPTVSLYLPDGITAADVDLQSKAYDCINRAVSGNGNIKVYCYKKKPAVDFQIQMKGV